MSLAAREKCEAIVRRHYTDRDWRHVCHKYEALVCEHLKPGSVVLDVGCGREFPSATWLAQCGATACGLDIEVSSQAQPGVQTKAGSVYDIPYANAFFDLAISSHVLEHLEYPRKAFAEIARVLKPGGRFIFLAPNAWDYVSILARLTPNAWHGRLVKWSEGREESATFPTYFRANTRRRIRKLAASCGLTVERFEYHNNYPSSLMFNVTLCRLAIAYDRFIRFVPCLRWLQGSLLGALRKE